MDSVCMSCASSCLEIVPPLSRSTRLNTSRNSCARRHTPAHKSVQQDGERRHRIPAHKSEQQDGERRQRRAAAHTCLFFLGGELNRVRSYGRRQAPRHRPRSIRVRRHRFKCTPFRSGTGFTTQWGQKPVLKTIDGSWWCSALKGARRQQCARSFRGVSLAPRARRLLPSVAVGVEHGW